MFGSKNNTDVNVVLDEGRTWVGRLEKAVEATQFRASVKDQEIANLTVVRDELDAQIKEGTVVANNFKSILAMD